jgi:BirA family biotin operon repressor/biotin-[acetyl-CoA-carboxylase] ligase
MLNDNWLIKTLDTVESTQDYAKDFKTYGQQIVITAQHQTKGYGQYGREWLDMPGNLSVSLIIPAEHMMNDVTLMSSIAIGNIIINHGLNIQYKWVNDILIDGQKVAGILTEYCRGNLIIGIGLNIKHSPKNIMNCKTTSLLENGMNISSEKFLELMLKSFTLHYNQWLQYGFKSFKSIWKSRAYKLNDNVIITNGDSVVGGIFLDIDDNGGIIVENENGLHRLQQGSLR